MIRLFLPTLALLFFGNVFAHAAKSAKSTHSVQFSLVGNLPIIKATVNGQTGNFIIDLGAAKVILNDRYFAAQHRSRQTTSGINTGKVKAGLYKIKALEISTLLRKNIQAQVVNLQHLEQRRNMKIHGLIGFEALKEYELQLDYVRKEIQFKQTEKGIPRRFATAETPPTVSMDIDYIGHLVCITTYVGEHRLRMALDSGAEINVLGKRWKNKLQNFLMQRGTFDIRGVSSQSQTVEYVRLEQCWIGDRSYPFMRAVLTDMKAVAHDVDGILGYEFFIRCQKVAIDFQNRRFHIWHLPEASEQKNVLVKKSDMEP